MGTPIVQVAKGGLAVTEAANQRGMPVAVAANGRGLAVTVVAKGGMPVVGTGGVLDPATLALIARMTTPPSQGRGALINSTILALKSAGLWSKFDALYLLAAADAQAASLNWKSSSYTLAPQSSPAFTADRGYQFDGVASYLETGLSLATPGLESQRDSAHMSLWSRTTAQGAYPDMGFVDPDTGIGGTTVRARTTTDAIAIRVNSLSPTQVSPGAVLDGSGHFAATRVDSASTRAYREGVLVGAAAVASLPQSSALSVRIGSVNGQASAFSIRQIAAATVGSGLSDGDVSALHNVLRAYLVGVGAA